MRGADDTVFTPNVNAAIGVLPTANGGTGLSSPGTVGNILRSNGTIWTSAAPGPDYLVSVSTGPTISGTGFQTLISETTTSLPAGTYTVEWQVVCQHTAAGSVHGSKATIGVLEVPTGPIDGAVSTGAGTKTQAGSKGEYVHAGGTIAILLQVRRSSGTGNIIPQHGRVELRRIA